MTLESVLAFIRISTSRSDIALLGSRAHWFKYSKTFEFESPIIASLFSSKCDITIFLYNMSLSDLAFLDSLVFANIFRSFLSKASIFKINLNKFKSSSPVRFCKYDLNLLAQSFSLILLSIF